MLSICIMFNCVEKKLIFIVPTISNIVFFNKQEWLIHRQLFNQNIYICYSVGPSMFGAGLIKTRDVLQILYFSQEMYSCRAIHCFRKLIGPLIGPLTGPVH